MWHFYAEKCAKPVRFFMRSTIWIAASHRKECAVSVLAANKNLQRSGVKIERGTGGNVSAPRPA